MLKTLIENDPWVGFAKSHFSRVKITFLKGYLVNYYEFDGSRAICGRKVGLKLNFYTPKGIIINFHFSSLSSSVTHPNPFSAMCGMGLGRVEGHLHPSTNTHHRH